MFKPAAIFIGLRYTQSRKENRFISFVSGFSMVGMALGVFALVLVLSVMNGFDREIKQRILKLIPHGYLTAPHGLQNWQTFASELENNPDVIASAPYIKGRVLLTHGSRQHGVELVGIVPKEESKVSSIPDVLIAGNLNDIPGYGIVIGRLAASTLGVTLQDQVMVMLPQIQMTPAGYFPRYRRFTVVGIFEAGAQVDNHLALADMSDVRKLYRYSAQAQGLRLKLRDQDIAPSVLQNIVDRYPAPLISQPWQQTQGSLFAAIAMEKRVTGLLLSLIVLVAAFNIVSSLVMSVTEKRHAVAVLRTIGATKNQILSIFLVQGMATGMFGALMGLTCAVPIALYLPDIALFIEQTIGLTLFDPNVFFISYLPSELRWSDVIYTLTMVFVLNVLATIYPAWRASQISPAAALEYS